MIGVDVIKYNFQLIVLLLIWFLVGYFSGFASFIVIGITVLLFIGQKRIPELILGFLFILVLSDSLEDTMNFAKSFKNIYILILFVAFVLSLQFQSKLITIYKYFIPYFLFALIGLFFSPVFNVSAQKLLSYILLYLTIPNLLLSAYEINGKYFFRDLIYFIVALCVVGFLIRFINLEVAYSHGGRLRGIFGNPNGLGIFLILFFILFAITISKFPNLFSRVEIIIIGIVIIYFLYKTGSRTALLAVVLFFMFNQVFKYSMYLGFILFFAILISMEFIVIGFPKLIVALGMEEKLRLETLEKGSGRTIAWEFAWLNIQESLFIGKGIAYDEYLMRLNRKMLSMQGHEGGVHNTYLIMWLNTGLFGLLSFIIGTFNVFIRGSRNTSYAFPALFAILLSINFEPWLSSSLNPFTILFVIIITLITEDIFNEDIEENMDEMEVAEMVA